MKTACDIEPGRYTTLLSYDADHGPECIYAGIEELLPEPLLEMVAELLPTKEDDCEESARAYCEIQDTIREYFEVYKTTASELRAPCVRHGLKRPKCNMVGSHCDADIVDIEDDSDEDQQEPLVLTATGVDCSDTTRNGSQKGMTGPSRLAHIVWSSLQKVLKPDVIVGECTEDWLPVDLLEDVGDDYTNSLMLLNPVDFGFPYNRLRACLESHNSAKVQIRFLLCCDTMFCCWTFHLQVFSTMSWENILEYYGRSVDMSFGEYWSLDGTDAEAEEFLDLVGHRVVPVDWHQDEWSWDLAMTGCEQERDKTYKGYIANSIEQGLSSAYDLWSCDVQTTPDKRKTMSHCVGKKPFGTHHCLKSHGFIMNSLKNRPLLALEWLSLHGFPMHKKLLSKFKLPLDFHMLLKSGAVGYNKVKSMVGLGWHAGAMGSFVYYLLCSLELRSDRKGLNQLGDAGDEKKEWQSYAEALEVVHEFQQRKKAKHTHSGTTSSSEDSTCDEMWMLEHRGDEMLD